MKWPFARLLAVLCIAGSLAGADMVDEKSRREALRHYREGQNALSAESWDKAEREFQAAVRLDPNLSPAHYGLGQVYMATKRYPEAVRAYTRCREAFQAEVAMGLMDRAAAERRMDEQMEATKAVLQQLTTGRVSTANTPNTIQRLEDEVSELERRKQRGSVAAPPVPPGVSLALGSAHFRTGAFGDAEREYRAALDVNSSLGEAHNNLAVVYMLTGRLDEAQKEVALAEKAGFKVHTGLKQDIEKRRAAQGTSKP